MFNQIHLIYVFILKTLVFFWKTFYHILMGYSIPRWEDFFPEHHKYLEEIHEKSL